MNGLRIVLADVDPAALPAALWLLKFLLVFTFILHLFFMNIVLGGAMVWLWAAIRARRQSRYAVLAHVLGRVLPVATAFAITSGVAPLLFTQLVYGQLFYTSSVLMAWPWLAIVGLLLAGYYANYAIFHAAAPTRRAVLAGSASVFAFALIAFLFTNNMTLMLRPEQHAPLYFASDAGLHTNIGDLWVWPRFAHMLVGSVAVTGLVLAWIARARQAIDSRARAWIGTAGTRLFMAATLVEFIVGIAFFLALPQPVKEVFLGGRTPDVLLLVVGAAFALAGVAIVRRSLFVGSCATIVALADMSVVRHRVRSLLLEPYFRPESLAVEPQTAVFLLFAVLLVAGLAIVGWMIWKFASSAPAVTGTHAASV